ncbi:MAG: prolyl oligopeptidase family serine peptidase [Proteobacteria bacterium]|nr:prolyl oligopeptidase family serine peptidase [Pseudomonadota bacterium]
MRKSFINPLNLQSFAAHGYVVVMPTMPGGFEAYGDLMMGVDPAIDALVAQGIADPQRLAVAGQSNGGFSTYGSTSQSRRFKAAIAMAGMTDLESIGLLFEQPLLARRQAEGATGRLQLYETWMNFDLPWTDRRYLDNSPLTHVGEVHTPVLMIHGDYDGAPIEQADEFYSALDRLGKPARYLRYFGDDHVLYSPANARDSWAEIFGWLQEYLKPSRTFDGATMPARPE